MISATNISCSTHARASSRILCCSPLRAVSARNRGLCAAAGGVDPSCPPSSRRTERLLPLLSELVETQARTASFETFAGRSAMIGFAVAALTEAVLPGGGLFGGFDPRAFSLAGLALVSTSAALAAASPRRLSRRLLEPVLASLTSKSRSLGSVSGRDIDGALDWTLEAVFTTHFLSIAFPSEADDPFI